MSRLSQFFDVKQVADQALAAGGGTYTLPTHGDAVHWRQRFYRFRKAWHKEFADPAYDSIILRRVAEGSATVHIEIQRVLGNFVPAGESQPSADLFAEAELFAKKLNGDIL